ncbi:hypothetical protein SMICM17S_04472 [Streptomyces microflavus]
MPRARPLPVGGAAHRHRAPRPARRSTGLLRLRPQKMLTSIRSRSRRSTRRSAGLVIRYLSASTHSPPALLVGRRQAGLRLDAPVVVVARRVGKRLPDPATDPCAGVFLDLQQLGRARPGRCRDPRARASTRPSPRPRRSRPSPSRPSPARPGATRPVQRRHSPAGTSRCTASTRKARVLAVTGLTSCGRSWACSAVAPPRGWPAGPASWSRPGGPSRRARRRSGPVGPRTSGRPGSCAPAPCTRCRQIRQHDALVPGQLQCEVNSVKVMARSNMSRITDFEVVHPR